MSTQQINPSAQSRPGTSSVTVTITPEKGRPDAAGQGTAAGSGTGPAPEPAAGAPAGTAAEAPGERPAPSSATPPRRIVNSLMWAVVLPLAAVAAGFLSQYPFGMLYLGIVVTLVVVATTAVIAGARWNRVIAATLASLCVFALPFFAGPTAYQLYAERLGHAVTAHITPGTHCHVQDATGAAEELTERQNCVGQFEPGQSVVLFRDPFGVLHPWVEPTGSRTVPSGSLATSGVLFALSTLLILSAGLRRRTPPAS